MPIFNREELYIKLLAERAHTVTELAEKLFVSEPTVRRDIVSLKEKELVECRRGVVTIKSKYADQRVPLFIRDTEFTEAKREIAQKAMQHVKDGCAVMLDASTTAYHLLAPLAAYKNILLITNGAKTALEAVALGIKTICTGGEITQESYSYVGPDAENLLRRYHADVAFFSCRGLTADGLATDSSILENAMRQIMIQNARKSFLLCDKSKFGQTFLHTLCQTDALNGVITNN